MDQFANSSFCELWACVVDSVYCNVKCDKIDQKTILVEIFTDWSKQMKNPNYYDLPICEERKIREDLFGQIFNNNLI